MMFIERDEEFGRLLGAPHGFPIEVDPTLVAAVESAPRLPVDCDEDDQDTLLHVAGLPAPVRVCDGLEEVLVMLGWPARHG